MTIDPYLISVLALACAIPLIWWLARRQGPAVRAEADGDRLDTLAGWPPEQTRILRSAERLALSTLKLALPGYLILAQVPIARFLTVPKRNSYAEWMRRLGNQCVDFVVCDVSSQVVAVVEIRPPADQISERLKARSERIKRALDAVSIPLHVWHEDKLPSIEGARVKILPNAPAVPVGLPRRPAPVPEVAEAVAVGEAVVVEDGSAFDPFADTNRDWNQGAEVIEVKEPAHTWFDDIDSVSAELPPVEKR